MDLRKNNSQEKMVDLWRNLKKLQLHTFRQSCRKAGFVDLSPLRPRPKFESNYRACSKLSKKKELYVAEDYKTLDSILIQILLPSFLTSMIVSLWNEGSYCVMASHLHTLHPLFDLHLVG